MRNILKPHTADKVAKTFFAFANEHKNIVLIALDPKTDEVLVGYKNKLVRTRIKSVTGKRGNVIKALMYESQFKDSMDGVIVALIDILKVQLRLPSFNQVANILDGALYNISKTLRKSAKPVPPKGLTPSPYADNGGRPRV